MSLSQSLPYGITEPKTRPAGTTELSWCRAVPGGTGITVLALLLSKNPNIHLLQNALRKLQIAHPILNSKVHFNSASNTFSYVTPPTPHLEIQSFDLHYTSQILQSEENQLNIAPLQLILEHEMNKNSWQNPDPSVDVPLFFFSIYTLENEWVVTLRLHTSVCDRASALTLLRELLDLLGEGGDDEGVKMKLGKEGKVSLGIEEYIPEGKGNKPIWARGLNMLGYSLNSFRLANFDFKDAASPRVSNVVKLELNAEDTARVLSNCQDKEIKLWALLAAAGLIACHCLKEIPDGQWEKYAVVTLMDCRSVLDPVLSSQHIGFYHSAILNSHDVNGGEHLWELANRVYMSFENAKQNNKHFSDMADLNFLMCKAIDNPSLTPSASLRTSVISTFEDLVIENSNKMHQALGLEDFIGCASVHGVGPSLAIFDTVRDGKLSCACVYPFPLHSREQMQEFIDEMKRIILEATSCGIEDHDTPIED